MSGPARTSPMDRALVEARAAAERGEVPIGCVIVAPDGAVLAEAGNRTEADRDPDGACRDCWRSARRHAKLGSPRLVDCDLYVTLEPCPMCAQAISFARLRRVYWGASDPKGGGIEHGPRIFDQPTCHHRPELYPGIGEARQRSYCGRSSASGARPVQPVQRTELGRTGLDVAAGRAGGGAADLAVGVRCTSCGCRRCRCRA